MTNKEAKHLNWLNPMLPWQIGKSGDPSILGDIIPLAICNQVSNVTINVVATHAFLFLEVRLRYFFIFWYPGFVVFLASRIRSLAWGGIICSRQTQLVRLTWCWCLQRYLAKLSATTNVPGKVCPPKWTNSTNGTCHGLPQAEAAFTKDNNRP